MHSLHCMSTVKNCMLNNLVLNIARWESSTPTCHFPLCPAHTHRQCQWPMPCKTRSNCSAFQIIPPVMNNYWCESLNCLLMYWCFLYLISDSWIGTPSHFIFLGSCLIHGRSFQTAGCSSKSAWHTRCQQLQAGYCIWFLWQSWWIPKHSTHGAKLLL